MIMWYSLLRGRKRNTIPDMRERRTYIRFPVGLEAIYQIIQEMGPPRLGMTTDLSLGGARLSQPETLTPGHEVNVTITLPKEGKITLKGVVVWCREVANDQIEHQAGVRWVEINPTSQARLNAFLNDRFLAGPQVVLVESPPPSQAAGRRRLLLFAIAGFILLALVGLISILLG